MEWSLSERLRRQLRDTLRSTNDARLCRRCEALLQVDHGRSVAAVSRHFGVSRQTLYRWRERADGELADQSGRGRTSEWTIKRVECLKTALEQSPREFGFQSAGWTVGMLKAQLQQQIDWTVSESSIRRQLHTLGYVWKRFRYALKPDPQREKKTPHLPKNQRFACWNGCFVPRRDRSNAVSTAPIGLGETRTTGSRRDSRRQRQANRLRYRQPNRSPAADDPPETAGR